MSAVMNSQRDIVTARLEADSSIPSLPYAVDELLDSLSNEDMGFRELADTISHFPDISARLVFLANSAWAAPSDAIADLERVCARLGFSMVRSISIAMVISSAFDAKRCPGFESESYWTTSLLTARLLPQLHRRTQVHLAEGIETVITAGLLHNIGLLWLADNLPDETSFAINTVIENPELSLRETLEHMAGMDYCLVGACLARAWRFPEVLEICMEYQADNTYSGESEDAVHLVGLASRMVSSLFREDSESLKSELTGRLGLSSKDLDACYDFLEVQHHQVRDMARSLFS